MKKNFKIILIALAIALSMCFISCSDDTGDPVLTASSTPSWYMHYFYTKYGLNSAMIRSPENSDVAILATTESGKGGNLYESTFVRLAKTKNGNFYTFKGSKNGTVYEVQGMISNASNGTTNDSFTIQSSSEAMQSLGFTEGKTIQHWTELNKGDFIY